MKMKTIAFSVLVAALSPLTLLATPEDLTASVTQRVDRVVEVTYSLDEDAIVTVEFFANGRQVGEKALADSVSGDVNRLVKAGSDRKIYWNSDFAWLGTDVNPLTAVVKAWDVTCPPDYMVAKVGGTKDDIRFYLSTNSLPDGGLANRIYTTERIVFRKIPAAGVQWRMGTTASQRALIPVSSNTTLANRQRPHYVTLTKDYYMSVYPLTQRQGAHYLSATKCTPAGLNYYGHPWNGYNFTEIRGSEKGLYWPAAGQDETYAHQVDEGSLIYNLRTELGLSSIDLPTHAQWEFAYRAGNGTCFYTGSDSVTEAMTNRVTLYAWSSGFAESQAMQPVGLLAPNPWGIYDMHGNGYAWVLDRNWDGNTAGDPEVDPRGTTAAVSNRIWLGSDAGSSVNNMYASMSTNLDPGATDANTLKRVGVRIVCNADMTELK